VGEFWELFASVILTGLNADELPLGLPPDDVELIPLVRSHRVAELPLSLVPESVARLANRTTQLMRPSWLPGGNR